MTIKHIISSDINAEKVNEILEKLAQIIAKYH